MEVADDKLEPGTVVEGYSLVNNKTGKVRPIILFNRNSRNETWERVFAKSLANMLDITGDEKTRVLAYLIRRKKGDNMIYETMKTICEGSKVSKTTVNHTMQLLQVNNYIHKIRNGVWRFSPHVMVNGTGYVGAAVVELWKDGEVT